MIRVEFFGIPRERAGAAQVSAEVPAGIATVGQVLDWLAGHLPGLGKDDWLRREFGRTVSANLNGERFVSDLDHPLREDDVLLLISADAGG